MRRVLNKSYIFTVISFIGLMFLIPIGGLENIYTLDLTVTSIVPESGVDNGITDIIGIFGSNFDLGAAVKLVRAGLPDIIADNVNVISSNKITCSFDLNGETTGVRDVIVTNTDGSADTLPMAFTVNGFINHPYAWEATDIGFGYSYMEGVAIGDGNNNNEIEVYGANGNGHIYQFKWNGTSWEKTDLGSGGDIMNGVSVGDGNNDGEIEVYGANWDNHIYQFKWNGISWVQTDLGSSGGWVCNVSVGDGNNDGEIEVYGANWDNHIYQFKWNGISWVQTDLGSGTCGMYEVAVGDGNNDGEIEVYGAGGYIYQFKWAGTSWGQTDFGSGLGTIKGVAVGDGNNDGEIEVYGANEDNHIYQFKWDGAAWEVTDLGSGVHWMADVVIGDGDNDGEIEVYGANLNNFIYQFKQTTVPDIVVTPDTVVIETSWLKEGTRNSSSKEIEKKTAIKLELIGLSSDTNPTGTMVVYNKGLGELEVSDITPIASWISEISPNNFVLSPEDSQVVVVTADISGLSPGTYRTHLFINSNDPDESTYIVRVKLIITYLTVTSIVPESGVDNGITDIIGIFGSNFDLGAAVKLVRGGLPDIIADNVNVISSNKITCSFDLNGETTGVRDVIVTNIDGSADTLPMAFTVNGFISPPYTWEVKDMGFSDFFIAGVSVGDGNNDGEVEVYGVIQAGAGCVYQFKWDGASWVQTELGSGGAWMNGVSIGDGNNDGEIEVYVASGFGHVYQFKWDGASWERTDLGSGEDEMSDVAIGDGNNDGEIEVYGASGFGHVYQFKRDVASWVRTELGFGGSWMQGVAVGDGNNDGEIEVYGANYDTHIYQFKWDSTSWVQSALGSGGDEMLDVAVGDGNNDGEIEIYCTNADNHIYQFKWDGASWEKTDLGSGGVRMVRVAVGDGNNDGEIEVYCANYDYHIYQFKWDGASWVQTDLGSGGHSMADVATGDGNNDGEIEVYGANSDGHIYQFKVFTDQGIMEKEVTPKVFFLFQNYPNPFVKSTNIKFCLPKDSYVNINIYNLSGQRVATLIDEHKVVGYYEINWDGLNDKGMKLEQGVYFYHLETEVFKSAKKIILLR